LITFSGINTSLPEYSSKLFSQAGKDDDGKKKEEKKKSIHLGSRDCRSAGENESSNKSPGRLNVLRSCPCWHTVAFNNGIAKSTCATCTIAVSNNKYPGFPFAAFFFFFFFFLSFFPFGRPRYAVDFSDADSPSRLVFCRKHLCLQPARRARRK